MCYAPTRTENHWEVESGHICAAIISMHEQRGERVAVANFSARASKTFIIIDVEIQLSCYFDSVVLSRIAAAYLCSALRLA